MSAGGSIIGFDEALAMVLTHARALARPNAESRALVAARGAVLAAPIKTDRDLPPFDRSTRDGYAVKALDLLYGDAVRVVGTIRAGEAWTGKPLDLSEAIEIMTGAPLPAGADAVVMVEHVYEQEGRIRLREGGSCSEGMNVVRAGSEAKRGDELLAVGSLLGPAQLALAAACGAAAVSVYERPRVAILTTGDELVELSALPLPQQLRNSNAWLLKELVEQSGGETVVLQHAHDERGEIDAGIRAAAGCELLVVSGGVSAGRYDFVEEALAAAGAEFYFTGVRMQPGRPVVFGRMKSGQYVFGLPGNPVSTHVTFLTLVRTLLTAMAGMDARGPRTVTVKLAADAKGKAGMTQFLPAVMESGAVRVLASKGSGDMVTDARADGYVVLPESVEHVPAGGAVQVLLCEFC